MKSIIRLDLKALFILLPLALLVISVLGRPDNMFARQEVRRAGSTAEFHHQLGVAYHLRRQLDDASREYALALELEKPRELTFEEWQIVRRFAPRIYTTPTEFFPLKDFAVLLNPQSRLIAYHFFWDDDIDFPEDNDPCDHELMWVQYASDNQTIEKIWTYFHGRILPGGETAMVDARQNRMRPRVNVQWGKHGSMPAGWENINILADRGDAESKYYPTNQPITLQVYQKGTFEKLSKEGRRLIENPLAKRAHWPDKFTGGWNDFIDFSRLIDPLTLLDQKKMTMVSRWNSATINQYFLAYNFRPKTEWPIEEVSAPVARSSAGPSLPDNLSVADFKLPAKSVFDKAMPRYPNLWFYIDASLAPSYETAVKLATDNMRQAMRLREYFGPFDNPEGCDFEGRLEHLQPWQTPGNRALQHSHSFHMRYYYSALRTQKLDKVELILAGHKREFYRFAASVHYEVEHTNPNHADVEICTICGRTGEYADQKGNLVERVHDPLGLELATTGKIRGEIVKFEDWEQLEVGSVDGLRNKFTIQKYFFPGGSLDQNTLRLGVVVVTR